METLNHYIPLILGVLMCAAFVMQLSAWTVSGLLGRRRAEEEFRLSMREFDQALHAERGAVLDHDGDGKKEFKYGSRNWNGLRKFVVRRLIREADDITSVYLYPEDNKPLPDFLPGQYLTFQLHIPDQPQPVVRCYSLSNGPREDCYRCSIKRVLPPPDRAELPAGVSSTFFTRQLKEGDTLLAKAPAGSFHLDLDTDTPVVLLAGGVGVTPMISMIKTVIEKQPDRKVVLFYGVSNSRSHAFARELNEISSQHDNIKIVTCYSQPLAEDVAGQNFQVRGRVSAELLARLLPSSDFEYYLCGPPAFMESLYNGLIAWDVPENTIHFESFGPASVKRANEITTSDSSDGQMVESTRVEFVRSGKSVTWNETSDSILELAEQSGVDIESGCRSGSCGTCVTRILEGSFVHLKEISVDLGEDECLACVAKPKSEITVDA